MTGKIRRKNPPAGVALTDLALKLEIDLLLGRKQNFSRRLRDALDQAFQRGVEAGKNSARGLTI